MSYTSKQAAQESQRVESGANKVVSPKFIDQRASTGVQLKQQQMMNASDVNPLQRVENEELLQGRFETVQRVEEEELLQGKFETAQLAEEEELLQGKFATAQLAEEEKLLQGKFVTAQLAEDEELLQGKFSTAQLVEDEEPLQGKFETAQLAEEEELLQGKFSNNATAQLEEKPNNTGLPNQLKAGIESLSGMSMDSVKVHYNSDKPAQLNAHAYAQGTDIHVAPGQEQHLPHEAWHVVQQAQGRVQPTTQMKGTSVNDDVGLETEADVMGAKAIAAVAQKIAQTDSNVNSNALQRMEVAQLESQLWGWKTPGPKDSDVNEALRDIASDLDGKGWAMGAGTCIKNLAATASIADVATACHVTIKSTDVWVKVKASLIAGHTRTQALKALKNVCWHITVEQHGANSEDNPRYFSDNDSWLKAGGVSEEDRSALKKEAQAKVTALGA